MRFKLPLCNKLRSDRRAVSPAISTVILTSAIVVLLLVTVTFANNFLSARMAESEFSAMEQFMQNVGLQIDDVAWIPENTRTIRYANNYGRVSFERSALTYTVYVNGTVLLANVTTGIILFNMRIDRYSLENGYNKTIFPSDSSFVHNGSSAPVSYVYVVEKLPMYDGSFIRVVVVPIMRKLDTTITGIGNYSKFYLPILSNGTFTGLSQSVTLTGKNVSVNTMKNAANVTIRVSFPKSSLGFDNSFFNFERTEIVVNVPNNSVVEFYTSEVRVSL
ncbi:MAG: hypothetical protein ACUVT9_05980 [Candidatus Bathycorpusculaceae bacterium]